MANANIFARMMNLFKGMFSGSLANMEKNNPEVAYENAIRKMTENYHRVKDATASIFARRNEIQTQLDQAIKDKDKAESNLKGALNIGDEALGAFCIQIIDEKEMEIQDLRAELEDAAQDCEDAKESLVDVQTQIMQLKAEKDRMLAKLANAEARNRVHNQLNGLPSVDADMETLNNVREHIRKSVAMADHNKEVSGVNLENKLRQLNRNSIAINSKEKFRQMMAEKNQEKGVAKELKDLVERSQNVEVAQEVEVAEARR